MAHTYDVITIGGGLAGAAFATVMARGGARVLVLERETRFRDRVRGEALFPWGAAELDRIGLRDRLLSTCAVENRWWDDYLHTECIGHRDTAADTPGKRATLTFYHPAMQEAMLLAAGEAGAEVRRGVRVTGVTPGTAAKVTVEQGGRRQSMVGGLVAGADGRASMVRRWAGFSACGLPPRLRIAGVLFDGVTGLPPDTTHMVFNPLLGQSSILIPQGNGRIRAYVIFASRAKRPFSGTHRVPDFINEAVRTGVRRELFDDACPAGPLATFEGADRWVDAPYRDGVALIGDAAATSDPSWGQGLSLAVRDARALAEALLSGSGRDAAGLAYAAEHDRGYATIRATEDLFTAFFLETGPEADARRARALPLIDDEPDRVPDAFMSGPDAAPVSQSTRARFFGEA